MDEVAFEPPPADCRKENSGDRRAGKEERITREKSVPKEHHERGKRRVERHLCDYKYKEWNLRKARGIRENFRESAEGKTRLEKGFERRPLNEKLLYKGNCVRGTNTLIIFRPKIRLK